MVKLTPRYDQYELERLLLCIKPVEKWTAEEHKIWKRNGEGFRHFLDSKIICLEHYRPKPLPAGHWSRDKKPAA